MNTLQKLIAEPGAGERSAFQKIAVGNVSAAAALSEIRAILGAFAGDGKRPTVAALNRIQDLAHSRCEAAPALAFTPEQLKMIADALLLADVNFQEPSEMYTKRAEKAATPEKVARDLQFADKRFCQSCEARELSEKISAELRGARQ